ncbi:MAG TPA: DUF6794 domain-containing protein [Urbifossiella sp.]|nr:DUF6794 domain-containing protein [Urbifossiella sp.]
MLERVVIIAVQVGVGGTVCGYVFVAGVFLRWWLDAPPAEWVWGVAGVSGALAGWSLPRLKRLYPLCRYVPAWEWCEPILTVVFFPALAFALPFLFLEIWLEPYFWPRTVEEAVERVLRRLGPEERERLRDLGEDEVARLHFGLGLSIRNGFGLWRNQALRADCGGVDADTASGIIIRSVLQRIKSEDAEPRDAPDAGRG